MSTKYDDNEKKPPPYHHQRKQPPPSTYSSSPQRKRSQQQQKKAPPPKSSETMMDPFQFPMRDNHDNVAESVATAPFPFHGSSFMTSDDYHRVAIPSSQNPYQDQKASTASSDGSVSSFSNELQTRQEDQSLEGVTAKDVLCGRDRVSHAHVGNKKFRKLIEELRQSYQNAPSREIKTQITCQVISTIHSQGGRFLKLLDSKMPSKSGEKLMWEEVSEQYAREKVSHALRSAKDPHRPKVKKRRQMKEYVPTPEEESLFRETFADQQQIFRSMVARHEHRQQQQDQNQGGDQIDAGDDGCQNDQDQSNSNDLDLDGQYDDFEFFS